MSKYNLKRGLYLIKQKCEVKGTIVYHYGILDIGNRLRLPVNGNVPIVIHQTPPRIRTDWLDDTGQWELLHPITDEPRAIERIKRALADDTYDLFGNNCEHFARYVAFGVRESIQLQASVLFVSLLATLLFFATSRDGA